MKRFNFAKNLPNYNYVWLPAIICLTIHCGAYYLTRIFDFGFQYHNIETSFDLAIPLLPVFIIIYIASYLQWAVGFGLVCRESEEVCYEVLSAEIIAKVISLLVFVVFPTTMTRPEITGTDFCSQLNQLIYNLDQPNNLLPSLHCLESWVLFRTAHKVKKVGKWLTPAWLIFVLLVFASVLFVKQHVIWDIPAAIIAGEIGLFVAKRFNTGNIFKKMNQKILKKGKEAVVGQTK